MRQDVLTLHQHSVIRYGGFFEVFDKKSRTTVFVSENYFRCFDIMRQLQSSDKLYINGDVYEFEHPLESWEVDE